MDGAVIALFPGQKVLHWQPLRRRKMMDADECQLGVGALAAGGFEGSNSKIMGRICSRRWSGTSWMVSSVALLPIVNPRPFAAYPNLKLVPCPSFEIIS